MPWGWVKASGNSLSLLGNLLSAPRKEKRGGKTEIVLCCCYYPPQTSSWGRAWAVGDERWCWGPRRKGRAGGWAGGNVGAQSLEQPRRKECALRGGEGDVLVWVGGDGGANKPDIKARLLCKAGKSFGMLVSSMWVVILTGNSLSPWCWLHSTD